MPYSKQVYSIAKSKLDDRRSKALSSQELRINQVYSKFPRLKEIDTELSSIGAKVAKSIILGEEANSVVSSLKEKSLQLQAEYTQILQANGYDKDYTEAKYHCDKCNDTGYYDTDNKTLVCDCFKKLLSDTACEQLNKISPLSLSTFSSFDLNLYSVEQDENGKIPYKRMTQIYAFCLEYAKNFSENSRGILMKGNTGLGKTHLSLAIANELIKSGFSVVYVSAPDILSKLEREHFSYNYDSESDTMQSLLDCDLLILDDLGTEFSTQFSKTAIYNLFNARINMSKPIIINTNMTVSELESEYSQRFVSRVMGYCDKLDFIGKDIRAKR